MPFTGGALPSQDEIRNTFSQISQVVHAGLRPLPTQTGDYTYLPEEKAQSNIFETLKHFNIRNIDTLKDVVISGIEGTPVDDKTYIMERVVQLASELPLNSKSGMGLTSSFLTQLWNDLKHPPLSYLGDEYLYRKADGSNNNILWPQIGAANTAYARSVRPEAYQPAALPEPGVIFDSVMVRKKFRSHPTKISSVLFYLASIIIHDIFRTSHKDPSISETSSYLDLAPLYGSNQAEQDTMRTFQDGKIKPDCFAEKRILGFPPGVGVLLIMFNRFHNYVVEQLAMIDENERFSSILHSKYLKKDAEGNEIDPKASYDNALFQTGRLITGGLYINCILKDYVRTILNLNRTNSPWDLDPRSKDGKSLFGSGAAEAGGNQVSAEFNLVYRWHSCISEKDEEWTIAAFKKIFPDAASGKTKMDWREIVRALKTWADGLPDDPQKRPFEDLKRVNGKFDDDELAAIFAASVTDCAGAYSANNVPEILREVEVLGILQARSWNLSSLNEFRKFFNLAPHKTFEDINSNPDVADQLKRLYDHPDFVELYPGLVCEEAKVPMAPGSGLCTTFTISRAVLSDAVALVRGDRFYTVDYTPKNLTNWGFNEASYDLNVDHGCVFYKLVLRAFPKYFKPNSVYAHYPLVVPEENFKILTNLKRVQDYNFDKPAPIRAPIVIGYHAACVSILENEVDFKVTWGEAFEFLMRDATHAYGKDYMLSGDGKSRELMESALYRDKWYKEVKAFYENVTLELLHQRSYKLAGKNQVDIVRDISNAAQVHFAASVFSLPLKTEENPHGVYADSELYLVMALAFTSIFYDSDPAKSFPLRQAARLLTQQLGKLVEMNVEFVKGSGRLGAFLENFYQHDTLSDYGVHMIQRLLKGGLGAKEIVWDCILPTASCMVANQSQLFSQCLDYYLSEEGKGHLPKINQLAKMNTPEADEKLLRYFLEGTRLRASTGLYRDVAQRTNFDVSDTKVELAAGTRVLCNLAEACMDPKAFPEPNKVILTRDIDSYIQYGIGPHQCLGSGIAKVGLTAMFKTIARLDNLKPAEGPQGQIKTVKGKHGLPMYMTEDQRSYFPFPSSMKINWDGELPPLKG